MTVTITASVTLHLPPGSRMEGQHLHVPTVPNETGVSRMVKLMPIAALYDEEMGLTLSEQEAERAFDITVETYDGTTIQQEEA